MPSTAGARSSVIPEQARVHLRGVVVRRYRVSCAFEHWNFVRKDDAMAKVARLIKEGFDYIHVEVLA